MISGNIIHKSELPFLGSIDTGYVRAAALFRLPQLENGWSFDAFGWAFFSLVLFFCDTAEWSN